MNAVKGIIVGLIGYSLVAVMNLAGKLLAPYMNAIDIVFWRGLIALILFCLGVILIRKWEYFVTKKPLMQLARATFGTAAVIFMMWALSILPIAVTTALGFTAPMVVAALAVPILGEKVGPWRVFAIIMAFTGVMVIVDPFSAEQDISTKGLLIMGGFVLCNASVSLLLRTLGKSEAAPVTVFYFLLIGVIFTGIGQFFVPSLPLQEVASVPVVYFVALLGVAGISSLILKTQAFVYADASLAAITTYITIIWAGVFDWLIWNNPPSLQVILGAAIIIGANSLLVWREKVKARQVKVV